MNVSTYSEIVDKLDKELLVIDWGKEDVLIAAENAIGICSYALIELQKIVIENGFKNQEEEIHFFKCVKPKVYSKFLYYSKILKIEAKCPFGTIEARKNYFEKEIEALERYFKENLEFYHYYRRKQVFLDSAFFVRGMKKIPHVSNLHFLIDKKFSTSHDYILSTIMAHEMLIKYYSREMNKLEYMSNNKTSFGENEYFRSDAKWTGSVVALVELIYAIQSANVINNGNLELKELAGIFEKMFNVKLEEYYRTFKDIQMRKTNRTKFLDILRESLLRRMDETES